MMSAALQDIDVQTKTEVLLEALPYIQRFRGSTFVVKYGGSFMDDPDPALRERVATDLAFLTAVGIHVVVVHGGGKAISRAMESAGLEATFRNGLRVTTPEAVNIVDKTLNEVINTDICGLVQRKGARPQPMRGNAVFGCRKLEQDPEGNEVDLGRVGDIRTVKTKLIRKAVRDGAMPVVSPLATDAEGLVYNTNADTAAARVAGAMRARRLVYLSDVPGLMRDPAKPETLISTLYVDEVQGLIDDGTISRGMLPKVQSAVDALDEGVHRVHFVDGRKPHSILLEIFTDRGIGTEICNR